MTTQCFKVGYLQETDSTQSTILAVNGKISKSNCLGRNFQVHTVRIQLHRVAQELYGIRVDHSKTLQCD